MWPLPLAPCTLLLQKRQAAMEAAKSKMEAQLLERQREKLNRLSQLLNATGPAASRHSHHNPHRPHHAHHPHGSHHAYYGKHANHSQQQNQQQQQPGNAQQPQSVHGDGALNDGSTAATAAGGLMPGDGEAAGVGQHDVEGPRRRLAAHNQAEQNER